MKGKKSVVRWLASAVAVLLVLALPCLAAQQSSQGAAQPSVDFDQDWDVAEVVDDSAEVLKGCPEAPEPAVVSPKYSHHTRDCVVFSFSPDDPLISPRVSLVSFFYEEECYYDNNGQRRCYDKLTHTERRNVRMQIVGRGEMYPWERDIFEICLDGYWLRAYIWDASHEYELNAQGYYDTSIEAKAFHKIPSEPDPNGIAEESFLYDPAAGGLKLGLFDKWANYYVGEEIKLTVVLMKDGWLWDHKILEKNITFPAQKMYAINFADYADEFSEKLKPGNKYYVKWRFKRVGKISKDTWQKYRKTEKLQYPENPVRLVSGSFVASF